MNNLERLVMYYAAGRAFTPRPRYFIYNATLRCDLACGHCGVWRNKKREELAPKDLERIIRRDFFRKVETAWITGGEPTLRQDLGQIAQAFRQCFPALAIVGIASNGYATERVLSRLEEIAAELDPSRHGLFAHLSLDGAGEIHDCIRGKEGAFKNLIATVEGIRELKSRNPRLKIDLGFNCVVQPENVAGLEQVKALAEKYSAPLTFNIVEVTDQYYCNRARAKELAFSPEARQEVIKFLTALARGSTPAFRYQYQRFLAVLERGQRDRRCLTLYSTFALDSDGTWIPCPLCSEWNRISFLEQDPEPFWKSADARELRAKVLARECPDCMLSCSLGDSLSLREFLAGGF